MALVLNGDPDLSTESICATCGITSTMPCSCAEQDLGFGCTAVCWSGSSTWTTTFHPGVQTPSPGFFCPLVGKVFLDAFTLNCIAYVRQRALTASCTHSRC
jgi:hypothetical protein